MEDCIFCKIIKGEIPCYKVYEDDQFLGFLDIHPIAKGHILLLPKIHYRWTYDIPNFGEYFEVAKKNLGLASQKAVNYNTISFFTFGFDVPHAHLWIVPRFFNDPHRHIGVDTTKIISLTHDEFIDLQNKITSSLLSALTRSTLQGIFFSIL